MIGLLNVDKPSGVTSRRVVDQVNRLVRPAKVGHAGTLDPLAEGVLIVAVGPATRLIQYIHRMSKSYRATFRLGEVSPTEDIEGQVVPLSDPPVPTREQLQAAARRMQGTIMQRPPAFSAIRLEGRRAYDLARRGKPVDLEPRPITVERFDIVSYNYPQVVADIDCSTGTYVRSLGRDLAESLGTGAVMAALVRTVIGSFRREDAVRTEQITADTIGRFLQPPQLAVAMLPQLTVDAEGLKRLVHGQPIDGCVAETVGQEAATCDVAGELVAVVVRRPDGLLWPACNLRGEG